MELKASDLRLGNLLIYEATTHIVSGIRKDRVYSFWHKDTGQTDEYDAPLSWYSPIPLTDEWYQKAGFTKTPLGHELLLFEHNGYRRVLSVSGDYLYIIEDDKDDRARDLCVLWNRDRREKYAPFYVHELQNLYHAISGKELTFTI
jgi:hypothetical protein